MKPTLRKILLAVRDVDHVPKALLAKTAALTPKGARIELFHALGSPVSLAISGTQQARETVEHAARTVESRAQRALDRAAKSPLLHGRRVSVHVTWDYPAGDAIVRRARAVRPDLIVAGVQPQQFAGRLLLANTDWELIREAPCPLLLARPTGRYRGVAVLAAIDPTHAADKPARLDDRLLATAQAVARSLGAQTHAFHAYMPLAAFAPTMPMQPLPISDETELAWEQAMKRRFAKIAARGGVPPSRRHLRVGDVPTELADTAKRTRADIVVMGALSRTGLSRLLIGNTAERVVDKLPCDLLVAKPGKFRSRVPVRAASRPAPLFTVF